MSSEGAERAITISALVVFGMYFYRHLTEGTSATSTTGTGTKSKLSQFIGFGTPANVGQFITAWGFAFFIIAIIGSAAPGLGGSLAILVATTDFLGNSYQLSQDIKTKLNTSPTSGVTGTASAGSSGGSGVTSDLAKGVTGSANA